MESSKLREALDHLAPRIPEPPRVALVLGSGLGGFADQLEQATRIPYPDIPHMPASGVPGHAGALVVGQRHGMGLVAMQGRVHLYEGHDPASVVFGVRLMVRLGARVVVLTNAAGGIRQDLAAGDLMLIADHLNLTGLNCLRGPTDTVLGERFVDMSEAYDGQLRQLAQQVAGARGLRLTEGVYAGLAGPSYETPAEIRMLRTLGADAVGMSTVLETIAARQLGARCLGLSCVTNLAAGLSPDPLSHVEVQETAARVAQSFTALVDGVLQAIAETPTP